MASINDMDGMTSRERITEVAAILATGLLRCRRRAIGEASKQSLSENRELDVSKDVSIIGHNRRRKDRERIETGA